MTEEEWKKCNRTVSADSSEICNDEWFTDMGSVLNMDRDGQG